jgi:putative heme-binding domain-containing protein
MRPPFHAILLALTLAAPHSLTAAESLPSLIRILGQASDPQIQLDILRGLRDATRGRPNLPMPQGWQDTESRLAQSPNPEIRALATSLGLTFGSSSALASLRATLDNPAAPAPQRQEALRALLGIRDSSLPATLQKLLADPALRGPAARALASFDDPATAPALVAAYPNLAGGERRDALNTLASRPAYARSLLDAIAKNTIPSRDLTAELVRQLRNLKDDQVNAGLSQVYGSIRDVPADKQAEIERYKRIYRAGGSTPGDAIRGRTAYAKVCQQCHTLFDVGGHVGPDLTGSNRGDLDYVLQNIIDPNAVIPNEYRASTFELKDGRVITGIVRQQDDRSITVATANETVQIPRPDIIDASQSQLSMMPEGLLAPLADQEFRDLIYYLGRPGQSPLLATPDTANLFFDGTSLALWSGDESTWSANHGEIIAKTTRVEPENRLLRSDLVASDFRITLRFHASPGAIITFRGEPTRDGGLRGYSLAIRPGAETTLADDRGRGTLRRSANTPPPPPQDDGWNSIEIVAAGSRILAAVNGAPVLDLDDPDGARLGLIAVGLLAAEGPAAARFKDLHLDPTPQATLTTLRPPKQ